MNAKHLLALGKATTCSSRVQSTTPFSGYHSQKNLMEKNVSCVEISRVKGSETHLSRTGYLSEKFY